jgi:hypothetical protein
MTIAKGHPIFKSCYKAGVCWYEHLFGKSVLHETVKQEVMMCNATKIEIAYRCGGSKKSVNQIVVNVEKK